MQNVVICLRQGCTATLRAHFLSSKCRGDMQAHSAYTSVSNTMTTLRCIPALQHGPHDDDVSSDDSTEGGSSCFTSPERLQPSPKPLTKRFPSIPPLSGQHGLATAAKPPLPATPLRQLQITSPDREGHRGRIYRDPQRHLLVSSPHP